MLFGTEFEHLISERWLASMRSTALGACFASSRFERSSFRQFLVRARDTFGRGCTGHGARFGSDGEGERRRHGARRSGSPPFPHPRCAIAASIVDEGDLRQDRQIGLDDALDLVRAPSPKAAPAARTCASRSAASAPAAPASARTPGRRAASASCSTVFPITEPDGRTSLDLADVGAMDRVRVVRSNSSVLFGSASGGLIDLVTHAPFDQSYSELRTSFGQFGLTRTHLKGGLVAGSARIRMSLSDTRFDGWRVHSRNETTTGRRRSWRRRRRGRRSASISPERATTSSSPAR
jgi:hypothetical protein